MKIYFAFGGKIEERNCISETEKTFVVCFGDDKNNTSRYPKERTYAGTRGGKLYNTQKGFKCKEEAINYAKLQCQALRDWAHEYIETANKYESALYT